VRVGLGSTLTKSSWLLWPSFGKAFLLGIRKVCCNLKTKGGDNMTLAEFMLARGWVRPGSNKCICP
jgi:hypothetical protein